MTTPTDDLLLPFSTDAGSFRGRLVRLGTAADTILSAHDYPRPVGRLLAETMVMAATLAGSLKYEGVFTVQIQSDGPVPLMMADVTSDGDMRAYARHDETVNDDTDAAMLLGKGYLAFTVDQGPKTNRYQGMVELDPGALVQSALKYFEQSEQIETRLKLAVSPPEGDGGRWNAAGLMLQRMPPETGPITTRTPEDIEDAWETAVVLMGSMTPEEMLDRSIEPGRVLYRMYHSSDLATFDPQLLRAKCRCSRQRVENTLASFDRAEVETMKTDAGLIEVTCEFCKATYSFDAAALDTLYR